MKKKKVIVPICILLIVCLVGGGVFAALQVQNSKKTVDVVSVNMVSTYAYEGYSSSSGRITSDVSQTVYLESEATIKDVYVQEGDTVTEGMPLMQYDTELMELDIETKRLDIQTLELNIQQTTKDIQSLKNGVVPTGGSSLDTSLIQPPASSEDNDNPKTSSALSGESGTGQSGDNGSGKSGDNGTGQSGDTPQPTSTAPAGTTTPPSTDTGNPENTTTTTTEPTSEDNSQASSESESQSQSQSESQSTSESQSASESSSESASESESEPESTDEPQKPVPEEVLDKDFDFSKYNDTVNDKGEIVIPCTFETKLTPEFIHLLRGKNADGSDRSDTPDPEEQKRWLSDKVKKVILQIENYDKPVVLEISKLNEPFLNTSAEMTLQKVLDNGGQLLTDAVNLDMEFFTKYPQALTMGRPILISATSETAITPEFVYILCGRNADGSASEGASPLKAAIYLADRKETLSLDGSNLALPYVTSIGGTLAEFIANDNELPQEPVKELGKDTPLDVSHDHREVFEIYCDDTTIITKDFINRIREENKTVILKIKDSSWITLDGGKMEAPSDKAIDTPIAEFIANGLALNEEQESTDDMGGDDMWGGGIDIGGGITYTADEIKKMLSDKQLELARLQTQKRQAQLDLTKLQKKLQNATVTSSLNGVVTKLAVLDENTSTSDPFMIINSTEGLYLTGSINELDLDTLTVGQTISAMSWNTGAMFDATIKEVSPYPASSSDNWGKNPNSSNYPFIARIDNPPEGLMENEYVEITTGNNAMMNNTEGQNLYLAKAYVRTDDNGESYIFVANSEGRLEKRTVITGKVYAGSYIEITNNAVTQEDYIAFPYGKNVREGVKVNIDEDSSYIFY